MPSPEEKKTIPGRAGLPERKTLPSKFSHTLHPRIASKPVPRKPFELIKSLIPSSESSAEAAALA